MVVVCRHEEAAAREFVEVAVSTMHCSTYKQKAFLEEAPEWVDCLTLTHYLFKQVMKLDIPLTYIGNMTGQLNVCDKWSVLEVSEENLINGDLIFCEKRGQKKTAYLTHVGVFLQLPKKSRGGILHTTKEFKRAVFQNIPTFRGVYQQSLPMMQAIKYVDHRDPACKEKGTFDKTLLGTFRPNPIEVIEKYNGKMPILKPRECKSPTPQDTRPGSTPTFSQTRTPSPSQSPVPQYLLKKRKASTKRATSD